MSGTRNKGENEKDKLYYEGWGSKGPICRRPLDTALRRKRLRSNRRGKKRFIRQNIRRNATAQWRLGKREPLMGSVKKCTFLCLRIIH